MVNANARFPGWSAGVSENANQSSRCNLCYAGSAQGTHGSGQARSNALNSAFRDHQITLLPLASCAGNTSSDLATLERHGVGGDVPYELRVAVGQVRLHLVDPLLPALRHEEEVD